MILAYQGEDVEEFFVRASKLNKEANFNDGTKHEMIMEVTKSDQSLLQFVLVRKARTFDNVRETCLEYAEHQKVYSLPKKVTENACSVLDVGAEERQQGTGEHALDKMDMLCKKFEDLALLITKNKP